MFLFSFLTMFMNNCCYHLLLLLLLLVFSFKLNYVGFYFGFSVRFLLTFELEQRLTKYNIINYASPPLLISPPLSHS